MSLGGFTKIKGLGDSIEICDWLSFLAHAQAL